MEYYVPDIYRKSIYDINYKKLKNNGIKCILFDLDNTIIKYKQKEPTKESLELINKLKDLGFKVIIYSNALDKKVKHFSECFDIEAYSFCRKPKTKKLKDLLQELKYNESEVVIIGDQILTDVLLGNTIGITTILTTPISKKELIFTKINRHKENRLIKKLSKLDLFYRGKYYE